MPKPHAQKNQFNIVNSETYPLYVRRSNHFTILFLGEELCSIHQQYLLVAVKFLISLFCSLKIFLTQG